MDPDIIKAIKRGGVAVVPTDTLYGIVGSAFDKGVVERIYNIRERDKDKPLIVLIGSLDDLTRFNIKQLPRQILKGLWPGKVSVILPCPGKKFEYLHRGTGEIAFRLPQDKFIREILKGTGPLVAPSANIQGMEPAYTIEEAENYFGSKVDIYVDKGRIKSKPSTLVSIVEGDIVVLRKGAVKVEAK